MVVSVAALATFLYCMQITYFIITDMDENEKPEGDKRDFSRLKGDFPIGYR
ncbi:hypothetical protein [Oceanobacillus polygoni]|uniref:Uncharacterized protein n=1 Tax=Oceanobacillus polygoni TaxID=1235259 RepID=A0A9X1CEC0_9BACI|nr:hypothetical protein [Oceanobacillus polygoni]MBP2076960.1 hypothetical protein [Oceanobacillus polygoni]